MRFLRFAAVVSFVAVVPAPVLHAQQSQTRVQLAFCNLSSNTGVRVAIMHRVDAQKWVVDGWYPVPNDGCTVIGSFNADAVYYYGIGHRREADRLLTSVWSAAENDQTGTSQCLDDDKAFSITSGAPECAADQRRGRFKLVKFPSDTRLVTRTLTD